MDKKRTEGGHTHSAEGWWFPVWEIIKQISSDLRTGLDYLQRPESRPLGRPMQSRSGLPFGLLHALPQSAEADLWQASITELKAQSLVTLAAGQFVLMLAVAAPYLNTYPWAPAGLMWLALVLLVGAGVALVALTLSYDLAAFLAVVSLLASSLVAVAALGPGLAAWSLALVVGAAQVLLGPRWAVGATLAVTTVLVSQWPSVEGWTLGAVLSGLGATWGILLISWMGVRPLHEALAWAAQSYQEARQRAEEAERHRGELGRTLKSLNDAYEHLERLTVELERARREAEQARALKARFASYISHELRTPLNLIVGFSEMMVKAPHTYGGEILPPAYRGDIESIYQSARHLSALINDILDLSQIDAHRMALDRDDVPLAEIVGEAVGIVQAAYTEKGLWLKAEVPADLPVLYLDRTRIRQVLINLLGNALRFTTQGGVAIKASLMGREVVVEVSDTGVGISPEHLPGLFHDFYQAHPSASSQGEGSGLGLAVAKRFVELHGGWMKAESTPGQGTTFTFGLPVSGGPLGWLASGEVLPAERVSSAAATLPTVAVLEGMPWLTQALQRYLDGYRVVPVEGGETARRGSPWANVTALVVPSNGEADGWQQLPTAAARADGLPVIYCSMHGHHEALSRLGVADYVYKPVTRERMDQVLSHWRPGRGQRAVLIVDDDQHMVRLLSRMVHAFSRHFRVLRAYDGVAALDVMRQQKPDLVLLDLLMPEMDGYTVLQKMREDESLREVPVVVVTARGMQEDEAVVAGAFGLVRSGGFPAGELIRCLKAVLDNLSPLLPDAAQLALAKAHPE